MRFLFIGDVHGQKTWEHPLQKALELGYPIIFLGDYLDSRHISNGIDVYDNLIDILEYKEKYPDKIILLLGNHDYNYMIGDNITGYDPVMAHDYHQLLNSKWDLFDLAWGYKSETKYTLVTHAGLSNSYYKHFILPELENPNGNIAKLIKISEEQHVIDGLSQGKPLELHEKLNFFKDKFTLLWQIGRRTSFPLGPGSIVWADKSEIIEDAYKGINQVIGHTAGWFMDIHRVNKAQNIRGGLAGFGTYWTEDTLYFINLKESLVVGALSLEL